MTPEKRKKNKKSKPGLKTSQPKGLFMNIKGKEYFIKEPKEMKSGGRVNLRGGGCAKRGVKKNSYGKNS